MNVYRRVRQGELPEGKEKVPWGTPSAHRAIRLALNKNEKNGEMKPPMSGSFSIFNFPLFRLICRFEKHFFKILLAGFGSEHAVFRGFTLL